MMDVALTVTEQDRLAMCEEVIEQGLATFVDVGMALLEVRDSRLYRLAYPTFEAYCEARWNMSRKRAYDLTFAAQVVQSLSPIGDIRMPTNEAQARELRGLNPDEQREVWQAAVETAPNGKVTAAHVRETAAAYFAPEVDEETGEIVVPLAFEVATEPDDEPTAAGPGIAARLAPMMSSDSGEWYTPPEFIEAVYRALGEIDLDPASSDEANEVVGAARYFTREDDALGLEWDAATVYLNPPYGDVIAEFIKKLLSEYEAGHFSEAVVLVPARTDTAWFRSMRRFPRCFINGRLKFRQPGTTSENSAPFPSAVFYIGPDLNSFTLAFRDIGDVYTLWEGF
jgi:phage N-6-adenine-methyltransferase